jgi:ribosomal protein S18 acetylase RimI-like enzyme
VVDRIHAFRRRLERDTADRVLPTRHGTAFLGDAIPDVYDHNYVSVEAPRVGAAELAADADEALADRHHRRVIVEDGTPSLVPEFTSQGYVLSTHLALEHTREPDRVVDSSGVREVPLDVLLPARTEATLQEPWGDEDVAAQLNEAKRQIERAVSTRFFAVFAGDAVAGWSELRVRDGVAQIEDVEVLREHRGRGLGRAIVQHALQEGLRAADVVFLEALADDWPRELYAKLGFTSAGRRDFYTRLPPPTTRLRLRTPQLELRVPTVAQLAALGRAPGGGGLTLVALRDGTPVGLQRLDLEPLQARTTTVHAADDAVAAEMRAAVASLAAELGAHVEDDGGRVPLEITGLEQARPALGLAVDGPRASA